MKKSLIAVVLGLLTGLWFVQAEENKFEINIQNGESTTYQVFEDPECLNPCGEIVLDENGKAEITFEKETYWKQSIPKKGYYADPAVLKVSPDGEVKQFVACNEPIEMIIEAYQDEESVEPHYQIMNEEGEIIYDNASAEDFQFAADKTYIFHELLEEEWQASSDQTIHIPLYKDPAEPLSVVFQHLPYGKLEIQTDQPEIVSTYSLYDDNTYSKTAKDIYGQDAIVQMVDGKAVFLMPEGEYYYRKETDPQYYDNDFEDPIQIQLYETTVIEDSLEPVQYRISVNDSIKKTAVSPVEICIKDEQQEKTETIDQETVLSLEKGKTYTISCSECPKGYFPFPDITFTTDRIKPKEMPVIETECIPFKVHILVKDADSGKQISDTKLCLNEEIRWNNSDSDIPLQDKEEVLFSLNETFSVKVENCKDPLYLIPDAMQFTVSSEASDLYYEIPCHSFSRIHFSFSDGENPLENIGYELYEDEGCNVPAKGIDGKTLRGKSDRSGNLSFNVHDGTYYGKVINTPDIYFNQQEIKKIQVHHQEITVVQAFEKTVCTVEAWDRENGKRIENAHFILKDANNQTREIHPSQSNTALSIYGLHRNMNYSLMMTGDVEGYIPLKKEQTFTMTDNCSVRYECIPYHKAEIQITDDQGKKAADATVAFYTDPECKHIAKDIFGKDASGNGTILMPKGKYYAKLQDIPLRFYLDDTILEFDASEQEKLSFTLKQVMFSFAAVNQISGEKIPSARFRIMDENGNFVNEGNKNIPLERNRTYYVIQSEIQGRFIPVSNQKKFSTPQKETSHENMIYMENQPYVSLIIREKEGDSGIAGIECSLYLDESLTQKAYDIKGNILQNITDENGSVYWRLPSGNYWLKENFEQRGYYALEPLRISVNPEERDELLTERQHIRAGFTVIVTDEEVNPVAGAVIEIQSAEGAMLKTVTSHHEPEQVTGDVILPGQKYVVHVKNVPDGYGKDVADIVIELPEMMPSSVPEVQITLQKKVSTTLNIQKQAREPLQKEAEPFPVFYAGIAAGIAGILIMTILLILKKRKKTNETEEIL